MIIVINWLVMLISFVQNAIWDVIQVKSVTKPIDKK